MSDLNHKEEIETSAANAVRLISDAAAVAAKGVAQAAKEAAQVVADAAAVSVKVLSIKNVGDHDLLIELKTRMEGLKDDIKDLKDGTTLQLADHELRLKKLEQKNSSYFITVGIYTVIVLGLIGLLVSHILK